MSMGVVLELYKRGRTNEARETKKPAATLAPWQVLQYEIRDRLLQLEKLARCGVMGDWEYALDDVNRKIKKYNGLIPTASLEKPLITKESFDSEIKGWKS